MTDKEAIAEAKEIMDNLYLYMRPSAIKRWESALSHLTKLAEEVSHRCDQRDAALESVGLLAEENAALKAEVDMFKYLYEKTVGELDDLHEESGIRIMALKAEVERWKLNVIEAEEDAEKAEAELDAARPLLEAAVKLEMMEYCPDNSDTLTALMKAALAYRERKGEGK